MPLHPDARTLDRYFYFCRERYEIFRLKEAGEPKPWTKDKVLRQYFFCNVFREDDKTTRWFRREVTDQMCNPGEMVFACVAFRMLNRIETGMDVQRHLYGHYEEKDFEQKLRARVKAGKPILGNAYMIKTPNGVDKVTGLMPTIRLTHSMRDQLAEEISAFNSIEWATAKLAELPYIGKFMAYEIATDLTHTEVLATAVDLFTWANTGPGAMRGLVRIFGNKRMHLDGRFREEECLAMMRRLLGCTGLSTWWPARLPKWTMREVEHTLCEFDKYERARTGQGSMKRLYDGH